MTFKDNIFQICTEVAEEFDDWMFQSSSGMFKNKTLGHTDLIVVTGLTFTTAAPSCSVSPAAAINNKKINKLFKHFTDSNPLWTLAIRFSLESEDYYKPGAARNIFPEIVSFSDAHGVPQPWPASSLVLVQAKDYFRKVMIDGISFIHKYFDLTSEENLLGHLPISYKWMDKGMDNKGIPGSFYEQQDGLMLCMAALVLGNFDFVERYASDDFKTMFPKRPELKKVLEALPDLKHKFAETGKVV